MHFRFFPAAFLLFGLFPLFGYADNAALPLKLDRSFKKSPVTSDGAAAFINARHVEARKDDQLEATGDVELRQSGQVVKTDHLLYGQESKDVLAEGSVRFEQNGLTVTGPVLKLNLDTDIGQMTLPQFEFSETHARGGAEVMHIAGKKNYSFDDATYTTCPAGNDDWLLRVSRLDIDRTTQVGVARNAVVEFKGVPILYTPWMDFPLNNARRSGFMAPSYGFSNKSGYELTVPYYWNITSNFDATFSPRVITKRGTQFNNEFRYLGSSYAGETQYDVLSNDRVSGLTYTHMALIHNQNLGGGFGLGLNLNRVSHDAYFRELSTSVAGTTQTNLLRDGVLSYSAGWWSASARIQRYQTLQTDPPPTVPVSVYRRQPQVTLNAQKTLADASVVLANEYTDFRHDTSVNGQRMVVYPSASYPLLNELGYYMTPKLGVHYTKYLMGTNNTQAHPDTTRVLPIFSLDNGMVFERDNSILGNSYIQTLEPRLYYVYIPYKDQDMLPNFDSAQAPFNFGQIFTENRLFGSDRIGDANMATLALTSRLIDNEGGTERLRVMLAERFSFKPPRVNLVAPTDNTSRSDILFSLGGQISRSWWLDSLFQYNPNQSHTESYNVMARYKPEPGKLLNLNYSFTRNSVRQADVSTQWPLFGRWQGMARLSYSLQDKRLTEAMAGLEYNQACWAVRMGTQSFSAPSNQRNTSFFLQLELNDLVHIGSDAMDILRNSVSGYTKMNSLPAE